jgi:hypothetical protein
MPNLQQRYEEIAEATKLVRQQSVGDGVAIEAAHAIIDEIRLWQTALNTRPEAVIFVQVISVLEMGIFSLVSGLYRQAYGSMRLAIELIAGLSWFSTHRLDLAEWQSGEKDLIWREITNQEEGVLSPRYRKAFFPELNEERRYGGLYAKLYRELSEYVHGNANTWTSGSDEISFNQSLHTGWLQKFETFALVVHVLLSLRYLQEISAENLASLEPALRGRAPQVTALTKFFDDRLVSQVPLATDATPQVPQGNPSAASSAPDTPAIQDSGGA